MAEKKFIEVQVKLQDKALKIVLDEQTKKIKSGNRLVGKERIINLLLTELYERRIFDTINPAKPMDNKTWRKYLDTQ